LILLILSGVCGICESIVAHLTHQIDFTQPVSAIYKKGLVKDLLNLVNGNSSTLCFAIFSNIFIFYSVVQLELSFCAALQLKLIKLFVKGSPQPAGPAINGDNTERKRVCQIAVGSISAHIEDTGRGLQNVA